MGPLGLVLSAFIISVSARYLDDFERHLPELSLCWLDRDLCNFLKSEDSKCEMNPRKREEGRRREPYAGYVPSPSSGGGGYAIQDPPQTPQPLSQGPETDSGITDGSEIFTSNLLDTASTAQPPEECCESTESADEEPMGTEEVSGEEDESALNQEHTHGLFSHEFETVVRSVDG